MPYWPPDTPPTPPGQMPQAMTPGPAPVPYGGPGMAIPPDMLAPPPQVIPGLGDAAGGLVGVPGADHVTEAPLGAPDVKPHDPGAPHTVLVAGERGPGGPGISPRTVPEAGP